VAKRFDIRGFLAAPLIGRGGEVLGVLRALSKEPREFTRREIDLFEQMANGAAIAIENSKLYQELQISNKVKSEFLGVMSHELRTPLNVITGYTSLLKEDLAARGDLASQSALKKIDSQSKVLLRMIDVIMEATSIESGGATVGKQQVDIRSLWDQLKYENGLMKKADVTLIWREPENIPVLYTDADKLQRILQHLIDNAIKFTRQGTITVSAQREQQAAGSWQQADRSKQLGPETEDRRPDERRDTSIVEFSVADTGAGIPADKLPSIFEMFKQVDSSNTRSFEGVGLGLYIVKKYAEFLGGTVDVESEVGKGSTFTVRLPADDSGRGQSA
jgi:signal transduction histidine kinase